MKLTLLAATGGVGRHLLGQALDAGHEVTAAVRNPRKLETSARVVTVDLADPDGAVLESAVDGADAVLSGLGAASKSGVGVAETGTLATVRAMRAVQTSRIVVVSAAPVGTVPSPGNPHPPRHDPGDGFLMRRLLSPMVKAALRAHYADLARMEDVLRDSGLAWTAVRPPRLTDKPRSGEYRTALDRNLRGGFSVSRADAAACMLACLTRPETVKRTVGVAR